jgi:branched-chain amino acid transport system substrate-binding protein
VAIPVLGEVRSKVAGNNNTDRRTAGRRLWMLALVVTLTGAACGSSASTGAVNSNTSVGPPIAIGALFDLSGPTADVGGVYGDGVRNYIAYRNQHGGVAGGRQINLMWNDFKYQVPIAEQFYAQYLSAGAVAIIGYGTGDTEALKSKITTDKIPYLSASFAEPLTDPAVTPYNFPVGTSYSDQMRIALKWIASQSPGHTEVAVFYNDSPFGKSPLDDGQKYVADQKLDIGYKTYAMPKDPTALVPLLTQAKSQGARYIVIQNVPTPAATLAKDVAQLGIGAKVVCLNYCTNEQLVSVAGTAANGVIGIAPWDTASVAPAAALTDPAAALTAQSKTIDKEGVVYLEGWYFSALLADAIDRAAKSGQLTGPAIKAALESTSGFDTNGESAEPLTFTSTSHKAEKGAYIVQVANGRWAKLSTGELTP